jgi:hypothetical protein
VNEAGLKSIGEEVAEIQKNLPPDVVKSAGAHAADAHSTEHLLVIPTDVSVLEQVVRLRDRVYEAWGEVGPVRSGFGPAYA